MAECLWTGFYCSHYDTQVNTVSFSKIRHNLINRSPYARRVIKKIVSALLLPKMRRSMGREAIKQTHSAVKYTYRFAYVYGTIRRMKKSRKGSVKEWKRDFINPIRIK